MAVYSFGKQLFTFTYFVGTVTLVVILLIGLSGCPSAPPLPNGQPAAPTACYATQFDAVGTIGLMLASFNFFYQVRLKYAPYDAMSDWMAGSEKNPDAAVSTFDIKVIRTHIPYDPVMFGRLETEFQNDAAQKIKRGELHAELITYEGNNASGREVKVSRWSYNESYNYAKNPDGSAPSVPIGLYVRRVAGLTGVTSIYMGMETRDPLLNYDDPNDGTLQRILKTMKRGWLAFAGGQDEGEKIPWRYVDDCDKRRLEVQKLAYRGGVPITVAPRAKSLEKLGAFVVWHDSLGYVVERDTWKTRYDEVKEKLEILESEGIRLDRVDKGGSQGTLGALTWGNPIVILLMAVVFVALFLYSLTVIGPALAHANGQTASTSTTTVTTGIIAKLRKKLGER